MRDLTFAYNGFHFTPYMKLTGVAGEFENMAKGVDYQSALFDEQKFSHESFYHASPIQSCDLFRCKENGKIYIPAYNLFEYKGELRGITPCLPRKNREQER